jgi:hypothetical protein
MKTMILAAVALLTLGVGAAHAPPVGWEPTVYGSQAFSDHRNDPVVHFLGKETVLGKMFRYNSNNEQMAAATTPAKGGLIHLPQDQASATKGPRSPSSPDVTSARN